MPRQAAASGSGSPSTPAAASSSFRIPECPTADGSVDSSGSGDFSATIEIRENGRVASRQSSVFEDTAKAHGEVGADAKLKSIELEHTRKSSSSPPGGS